MMDNINNVINNNIDVQNFDKSQNLVNNKEPEKVSKNDNLSKENIEMMKAVIKSLNDFPSSELRFSFNDEAKIPVVEVYETKSYKLLRQFPSKDFFNRLIFFRDNILP